MIMIMILFQGKKRDRQRMEEHNRTQEEKEADQKKQKIAELKASRKNAERKFAALTDEHEKTQDELSKMGLSHYLEQRN